MGVIFVLWPMPTVRESALYLFLLCVYRFAKLFMEKEDYGSNSRVAVDTGLEN